MITKRPYEEYMRYHNFVECLAKGETITSATAFVVSATDEDNDYPEMISNVAPHQDTYVKFKLKGGERNTLYKIIIRIETSNNQKFEDHLDLKVL